MFGLAIGQVSNQIGEVPSPFGGLLRLPTNFIEVFHTISRGRTRRKLAMPERDRNGVLGVVNRNNVRAFTCIVVVNDERRWALL
jgi:hypothetical protein